MNVDLLGGRIDIETDVIDAPAATVRRQLREYEAGDRRRFELRVAIPDSITGRAMAALAAIPYGGTRTYAELARELDTSPRAVGGACGRNPAPVVVPCHRVIRSDGGLGGYSGAGGVALKRRLLDHEASHR